jgi:hypothetical protein
MKTAKASNEGRIDTIGFRSQHLALSERLDTRGIHQTDHMPSLA